MYTRPIQGVITQNLSLRVKKCFKMHVGRSKIPEVCPELVIDGWKINEVKNIETNLNQLEDEYEGLSTMETVEDEKYLGDIIKYGENTKSNCHSSVNVDGILGSDSKLYDAH